MLVASQPTRGLDVGSIEFVHRRIIEQRDHGVAVLIVSAELDEIYALADRIAVMYEGKITGFRPPTVPAEELGRLMAGGSDAGLARAAGAGRAAGPAGTPHRNASTAGTAGAGAPERANGRADAPSRSGGAGAASRPSPEPGAGAGRGAAASGEPRAAGGPAGRGLEPGPAGAGHPGATMEGNSFTVTVLAIVAALVVGGLINAFSNTTVLHAWGNLFSAPGHAFAVAWDTAVGAYVELFEGSIFNPHTVSALFSRPRSARPSTTAT